MSVVGPRPVVMKEITKYGEHIISLISVMPGITGLWQVSGRNNISYEQRVLLDDFYAKNNSFLMDLKIIFKTIFVMVNKSGAY